MKLSKLFLVSNIILLSCLILVQPLINIVLYPIYFVILVIVNEKMKESINMRFRYLWMFFITLISIFTIALNKDVYMIYLDQYYYLFISSVCVLFLLLPLFDWSKILSSNNSGEVVFSKHKLLFVFSLYMLAAAYAFYLYFG